MKKTILITALITLVLVSGVIAHRRCPPPTPPPLTIQENYYGGGGMSNWDFWYQLTGDGNNKRLYGTGESYFNEKFANKTKYESLELTVRLLEAAMMYVYGAEVLSYGPVVELAGVNYACEHGPGYYSFQGLTCSCGMKSCW